MLFKQGINFRDTSGFVTDGTNEHRQIGHFNTGGAYPLTSPQGTNYGWTDEGTSGPGIRINVSSSIDRRLAGLNAADTGLTAFWRMDLPSAGTYSIRMACGWLAASTSFRATGTQLFDGTTFLRTLARQSTNFGEANLPRFFDADDRLRTSVGGWVNDNVAISVTFATTVLRLRLFNPSGRAAISHIFVEEEGGAPAPINLDADALSTSHAFAALDTAIPLHGQAYTSIFAPSGDLASSILLDGVGSISALAQAELETSVSLDGSAVSRALSAADLSTAIPLHSEASSTYFAAGEIGQAAMFAGVARAQASSDAELTTGIYLSGDATTQFYSSAALTHHIRLAGQAIMRAGAEGGITQASLLSGVATMLGSATAQLNAQISFNANAPARFKAAGLMGASDVALNGAAMLRSVGAGNLLTQVRFDGLSAMRLDAVGSLALRLAIAGQAVQSMQAHGSLFTLIPIASQATIHSLAVASLDGAARSMPQSPRYTVRAARRNYRVAA